MLVNHSVYYHSNIKPDKVLHWAQIGKIKSDLVKGFPSTKGLTTHEPIMGKPTEYLVKLSKTMLATCKADDGVGLAAPQIGVNKRIIMIAEVDGERITGDYKLYINPAWEPFTSPDPIVDMSIKEKVGAYEGCLSVPDGRYWIERFDRIVATWFEHDGEDKWVFKREVLGGYPSRIFQHETDHCENRSIVDRWKAQDPSTRALMKSS